MNHYTYMLHYSDGKAYIGVRSCKTSIEDDAAYIGSSKYTPNDLLVKKEILGVFASRKEAVAHEIHLHALHQVATSDAFYNRSCQTATKFDTCGTHILRTAEHNEKIRQALTGRKRSEAECLNISKGKIGKPRMPHSAESIEKIRMSKLGHPGYMKGQQYSLEDKLEKYASRTVYSSAYHWINTKSGAKEYATCIEMGHKYGTGIKPTGRFRNILKQVTPSYKGWVLDNGANLTN